MTPRPPVRLAIVSIILTLTLLFAGCASGLAAAKAPAQQAIAPKAVPVSPQFNVYQAYLWYVFHKIQTRWQTTLKDQPNPGPGKKVTVAFAVSSAGQVTRIKSVEGDAGQKAEEVCVMAITSSVPFPKWSEEMRTRLGDEQVLVISFNYQ